jgi:capsular polysaccharide export protein
MSLMVSVSSCQFLKAPPFPGARHVNLGGPGALKPAISDAELNRVAARVRGLRVGGTYWAARPVLPAEPYVLVRVRDAVERARQIAALEGHGAIEWLEPDWPAAALAAQAVVGPCDPWHLLAGAEKIIVDAQDDAALFAFIAEVPAMLVGEGAPQQDRFREIAAGDYRDPFTGEAIGFEAAAEICGSWRSLIDSNRDISAALGFAFWKRKTVAPLLWDGVSDVPFVPGVRSVDGSQSVAIWQSRTAPAALAELESKGARLIEVEDGFIRSIGLGADCVPPLSIVVDRIGIYFDPGQPSDLERLLENESFAPQLVERARRLRLRIVELGLSKYAIGDTPLERRSPDRRHLLVTGQVEDDRAVLGGGGPRTNLELLQRVRAGNPDAYILYKPHPDVEAGHRPGAIPEDLCLETADEVVRDAPISSLIGLVDEVHVNTSLAGFEALLREKPVTTYGVPFYAGWGLSTDLGPVSKRRTKRRSLDELVAAALILYPRNLDPVTGLPCPPEILIDRLSASSLRPAEWGLVQFRRLQGQWNRAMAALRQ